MKIVIAPDSYKESLTALEVAIEIEAGFRAVFTHAEYIRLPMADGGWNNRGGRNGGRQRAGPGRSPSPQPAEDHDLRHR